MGNRNVRDGLILVGTALLVAVALAAVVYGLWLFLGWLMWETSALS